MRFMASVAYRVIKDYNGINPREERNRKRCLSLMKNLQDPFNRFADPRHFTSTACIVDKSLRFVLLVKHNKLNRWVFPGGHCDGEQDTVKVARTETFEETGLKNLKHVPGILDIAIYQYDNTQLDAFDPTLTSHADHDITHLFIADRNEKLQIAAREISEARWVPIEQLPHYYDKPSHHRIVDKIAKLRVQRGRNHNKDIKLNGWK